MSCRTRKLAAALVLAFAAAGLSSCGHANLPRGAQHASGPSATQYFDPLRPYLAFGWLPPGTLAISGESGTTAQALNAGQPGQEVAWMLSAYAAGFCSFTRLHFRCAGLGTPPFDVLVPSRLPDIGGHPAYWTGPSRSGGILIWRYARDNWAMLDFGDSTNAVQVAEHVMFGRPATRLRFPAQLIGMPGWQLKYARFQPARAGSLVTEFGFATGAALHAPGPGSAAGYPEVVITKSSASQKCRFTPGQSTRSVVAGYPVIATTGPSKLGGTFHEVCAASADGLWVDVLLSGRHPAVDVSMIFAHLKLLGPDPASWTTQPIG